MLLRRFIYFIHLCRLQWHQLSEADLRGTAAMARQTARECEEDLALVTAKQCEIKQRMQRLEIAQ